MISAFLKIVHDELCPELTFGEKKGNARKDTRGNIHWVNHKELKPPKKFPNDEDQNYSCAAHCVESIAIDSLPHYEQFMKKQCLKEKGAKFE